MPRKKEQNEQDLFDLLKSIETQLKLMDKRMEVLELQQKLSETKPGAASSVSVSSSPSVAAPAASPSSPEALDAANSSTKPATGGSRAPPAVTDDPARDLTPFGMLRRLSLVA